MTNAIITQETSLLSWIEVRIDLGERQYAVLNTLRDLGEASNTEIATRLGWSINRVTPRIHELRREGLVMPSCRRACKVTGRQVVAWKEVPKRWE